MAQSLSSPVSVGRERSQTHLAEVQALRALAVIGVVVFHFWPSRLPGGFVGVDVFYVISGFLITGMIARSLGREDFSFRDFYVRRARRLLPAATLVLGITAVAVLGLPYSRWLDNFQEILASLFYVQNWLLALNGSDYFTGDPTAVQHYWSLSVEEQFYIVWPAFLVGLWLLRRTHGPGGPSAARQRLLIGMAAVSALSLALSITTTLRDPTLAFYGTHTRVWEFGLGGVLALLPRWSTRANLRALVSWLGLGGLLLSFLWIDSESPFPGWIALMPVLATVAIIGAGVPASSWAPSALFRLPVVQWLGDISYSLYLWHWPPIVLLPLYIGRELTGAEKGVLFPVVLALAWVTKVHVEDRIRQHAPSAEGAAAATSAAGWSAAASGALISLQFAVVVAICGTGIAIAGGRASSAQALESEAVEQQLDCFGAAALANQDCAPPLGEELVPDPAVARATFAESPDQACMADISGDEIVSCEFGSPSGDLHVVLIGDSHGLMWLPALQEVAEKEGLRLTTYLRGSCPPNLAVTERWGKEEELCERWSKQVIERVIEDDSIDLVVTTAKNNKSWVATGGNSSFESAVGGYVRTWTGIVQSGKRVLVIKDAVRSFERVVDCLAETDPVECSQPREVAEAANPQHPNAPGDPQVEAARRINSPWVAVADPVNQLCESEICPAVIGNVVVYVDESHLTPTYSRTLSPWLGEQLANLWSQSGARR